MSDSLVEYVMALTFLASVNKFPHIHLQVSFILQGVSATQGGTFINESERASMLDHSQVAYVRTTDWYYGAHFLCRFRLIGRRRNYDNARRFSESFGYRLRGSRYQECEASE
jgi:hypothetical protein